MLAAVPCSRVTKIKRVVCFPRSRFRGLAAGSSLTRSRGGGERMDKGWMVKRERKVKRRSRVLAVEEMPRGQAGFLPIRHLVDSFLWFLGSLCENVSHFIRFETNSGRNSFWKEAFFFDQVS